MTKQDAIRYTHYTANDRGLSFAANIALRCSHSARILKGMTKLHQAGTSIRMADFSTDIILVDHGPGTDYEQHSFSSFAEKYGVGR